MAKKNLTKATQAAYVAGVLDGSNIVNDVDHRQLRLRSTNTAALKRVSDILVNEGITHSFMGLPKKGADKYWSLVISGDEYDKAMALYEPYMA